jgi:predicted aminopeptidase
MSQLQGRMVRTALRLLALGAVAALAGGCASMNYYAQAASGQLSLVSGSIPIDDLIAAAGTNNTLRLRLEKARLIRRFAVRELGLPDNGSYKKYSPLSRPYVLWNVVATPELSLTPVQSCFPVAGCVSYRGYYSRADAQAYAKQLRAAGNDVQIGGVTAYSTLGWFNDPLISTFINYPDPELARLLFHELAHQMVYVAGDSRFNESFASAVEEAGVQRWIAAYGDPVMRANYMQAASRKHEFLALLMKHRRALDANYRQPVGDAVKRQLKARIFADLQDDYQLLKAGWGGFPGYDRWFAEPLSNAHLASVATYNDFIPGFRVLLAREHSFPRFYEAVRALAQLGRPERDRRLAQLSKP